MAARVAELRSELRDWMRSLALDPRSLTLFRVGLGAVVVLDVLLRLPFWSLTLTESGYAPRWSVLEHLGPSQWSLYMLAGHEAFALTLLLGQLVGGVWLMLGFRSRLAAAVTWVLVMSLHARAPMLLNSGDVYLRLMLLWSVFLPLHRSIGIGQAVHGTVLQPVQVTIGEIGLRVQVALVYVASVFFKTGLSWTLGTAVFDTLSNGMYARPLGQSLLGLPTIVWLPLTYMVLVVELVAPLLLFLPARLAVLRTIGIAAIAILHATFIVFLDVGWVFPLVGIVAVSVFVPGAVWERLGAYRRPSRLSAVYYDGGCGFCRAMVRLLLSMIGRAETTVRAASDDAELERIVLREHSWVVVTTDGMRHLRADGLVAVFGDAWWTTWLAVLLRAPGVALVSDRAYRLVADRRPNPRTLNVVAGHEPAHDRRTVQALAAALLVLTLAVNLASLGIGAAPSPAVVTALGVQQRWSMFSPIPATDDGWFELHVTARGTTWDVLGTIVPGAREEWRAPRTDFVARNKQFGAVRWRKALHEASRQNPLALVVATAMVDAACNLTTPEGPPESSRLVHFVDTTSTRLLQFHAVRERVIVDQACLGDATSAALESEGPTDTTRYTRP